MPQEIIMPKLGFTHESSDIVEWLVDEGSVVEKGDAIAEVTTDKVNMELDAPGDGVLAGIRHQAGDNVSVGTILAYILKEGEEVDLLVWQAVEQVRLMTERTVPVQVLRAAVADG